MSNINKYFILACLYTAQVIPGKFAASAMPVIMRNEGMELKQIGLVGIISLPWALKFLWAPLVDRYFRGKNHYKKWIFVMQIIFAFITFGVSFLVISEDFKLILFLMTLSYIFASTQDIAVDGYAVKMLEPNERGIGNGIQAGFNMFGSVVGVSIGLMLYNRTSWHFTMTTIFIVTVILAIPVLFGKEKESDMEIEKASYADMLSFFKNDTVKHLVPVLFFSFSGIFCAIMMMKPLLRDLGYSIDFISLVMGLYPLVGLPAAMLAGLSVNKFGRKFVILFSIAAQVAACFLLIPIPSGFGGEAMIHIALIAIFSSLSMLMAVFNTVAMDLARKGREGMDFTIFMSITFFGGTITAMLSGFIAQISYELLFSFSAFLCVVVFVLTLRLFKNGWLKNKVTA